MCQFRRWRCPECKLRETQLFECGYPLFAGATHCDKRINDLLCKEEIRTCPDCVVRLRIPAHLRPPPAGLGGRRSRTVGGLWSGSGHDPVRTIEDTSVPPDPPPGTGLFGEHTSPPPPRDEDLSTFRCTQTPPLPHYMALTQPSRPSPSLSSHGWRPQTSIRGLPNNLPSFVPLPLPQYTSPFQPRRPAPSLPLQGWRPQTSNRESPFIQPFSVPPQNKPPWPTPFESPPQIFPVQRPPHVLDPNNATIRARYDQLRGSIPNEEALGRVVLELTAEGARIGNNITTDEAWSVLTEALNGDDSDGGAPRENHRVEAWVRDQSSRK